MLTAFLVVPTHSAYCAESLAGEYLVKGWDPGNEMSRVPDYKGWVQLTLRGEVWDFQGFMDGHKYKGVGLYDGASHTLSLSFANEDNSENGVTVLKFRAGELKGQWAFGGCADGRSGTEIWTRKK